MDLRGEQSSLTQRDAHYSEITVADSVDSMTFWVLRCGLSFDHNVMVGRTPFETAVNGASDRRSTNARQLFYLLYRFLEESPDTLHLNAGMMHAHCKQVCSVEPRLDGIEE